MLCQHNYISNVVMVQSTIMLHYANIFMLCQHNYFITISTLGGCGGLVRIDFQ